MEKRDWNKLVAASDGRSLFLPEQFKKRAEEWQALRKEYNEKLVPEMARKELAMNMALQNILYDLRVYLDKNGHESVFLKDIGFDTEALEDGKFVVNLLDPSRQQIPRA